MCVLKLLVLNNMLFYWFGGGNVGSEKILFGGGGGGGNTITAINNCIGDHYPILLKKYVYILQVRNSIGDISFCRRMILA